MQKCEEKKRISFAWFWSDVTRLYLKNFNKIHAFTKIELTFVLSMFMSLVKNLVEFFEINYM